MRSHIIPDLIRFAPGLACAALCALPLLSQEPIYRVTVVERTVKAINYEYRKDPTMIDFRGTVLMPKPKAKQSSNPNRAGQISTCVSNM